VSKNVAVFVDVANIFYAAKAAGVDIDYVTLLKSATAGRDFVRAYAYTGLDPENENQRQFHAFLARNSYKVVSKDIRKYGDGKVKANLDIELVVDMMKTARNLDIAVIISGDGDFAPAIRAVQEMGVRVEVISFRGNTSSDLIEAADQFIEITQVAKVEKASTRSGRRVASDEADLSMTEVPEKETEGTGRTRRRRTTRTTEAKTETRAETGAAAAATKGGGLVALPGEKLSKAAAAAAARASAAEAPVSGDQPPEVAEAADAEDVAAAEEGEGVEGARRRRRRRGGRGRGRRRADQPAGQLEGDEEEEEEEVEVEAETAPPTPGRRPTPFGSVWDAQIGTSTTPSAVGPLEGLSDEDLEEPEVPEYLLAERRQRGQRGRGQGRGGRSAYQSAIERERYGRGGMTGTNRYPDTSGRGRSTGRSEARDVRPASGRDEPRSGRSAEPWSEVPPELEALLRAQAAGRADKPRDERPRRQEMPAETAEAAAKPARGRGSRSRTKPVEEASVETPAPEAPAKEPSPTRRRTRRSSATTADDHAAPAAEAADKPATTARRRSTAAARTSSAGKATAETATPGDAKPATRRRRSTKADAAGDAAGGETSSSAAEQSAAGAETAEAPKRRRRTTSASKSS
jgi:uncharacterized LabA/DUF88 family protein